MTDSELQTYINNEPLLSTALKRVVPRAPVPHYGAVVETAAVVALLPVVRLVISRIGLPWLYTASRWSELKRLETERWLGEQYHSKGFDLNLAEENTRKLIAELENTTDPAMRRIWEELQSHMITGDSAGKEGA